MTTSLYADYSTEELQDKLRELTDEKRDMEAQGVRSFDTDQKDEWDNLLWEIDLVEKRLRA